MLKEAGLELADKHLTSEVIDGIELVIGGDFYGEFITGLATYSQTRLSGSPGGYLIYGQIPNNETIFRKFTECTGGQIVYPTRSYGDQTADGRN